MGNWGKQSILKEAQKPVYEEIDAIQLLNESAKLSCLETKFCYVSVHNAIN